MHASGGWRGSTDCTYIPTHKREKKYENVNLEGMNLSFYTKKLRYILKNNPLIYFGTFVFFFLSSQVIPKPQATAQLILTAIEQSVLFKNCGKEDFTMLVEAFAPVSFPKGAQVITQVYDCI